MPITLNATVAMVRIAPLPPAAMSDDPTPTGFVTLDLGGGKTLDLSVAVADLASFVPGTAKTVTIS